MLYHIVVCDDEKEILGKIAKNIEKGLQKLQIAASYTLLEDSRELVNIIKTQQIDILFLDIDMPYFGGMDVAGMINDRGLKTLLVFVTGYDALVYKTFEYRPFAFIRKSYFSEEIDGVLQRLAKELVLQSEDLVIKKGREVIKIPFSDILYVESEGNYINVFTQGGEERYRDTLSNIQAELPGRDFVRCHKGYIVNTRHIVRINSSRIELNGGAVIPIGRSFEKEIRQKVLESMRN